MLVQRGAPTERCLANGEALVHLEATSRDEVFSLSDGTELGLSMGTQVDRIQNDGTRLVLRQSNGRVRYRVAPQGSHAFVVEAGIATVEVVGTEFTVERHRVDGVESVDVEVMHGVVVVRSEHLEEHVVRMEAGVRLHVEAQRPPPNTLVPDSAATEMREASLLPALEDRETDEVRRSRTMEAPSRQGSTEAPGPDVSETTVEAPGDAEESDDALLSRADAYRREGRGAEARALLERVVAHGRAPQASLAAFSLGTLLDDALLGTEAERTFERAIALGLPSALVGAAWAHLAELRGQRGDLDGAHDAAERALDAGVLGRERTRAEAWR
jgi:transmembrane sensor